jgi:hypothetical protein
VIFHFNKGHIADPTIPPWVLKCKGETWYVQHVDCEIPWSTKETPDNPSTKGSIRVKNALVRIDGDNTATLTALTPEDRERLRSHKKSTRIIALASDSLRLRQSLRDLEISHGPIKTMGGACTDTFHVTDIYGESELTALLLAMAGSSLRVLMPNEYYHGLYDDPKYRGVSDIDLDADSADDES